MITLKERVCELLLGTCEQVVCGRPAQIRRLPVLCWRESQNRCHAQADGAEYLAELNYSVDIFADSPESAGGIAAQVDARLTDAGFRREGSAELYEADAQICHVNLRYRALSDAQGKVYQ